MTKIFRAVFSQMTLKLDFSQKIEKMKTACFARNTLRGLDIHNVDTYAYGESSALSSDVKFNEIA